MILPAQLTLPPSCVLLITRGQLKPVIVLTVLHRLLTPLHRVRL
jgi:hypothetical protein